LQCTWQTLGSPQNTCPALVRHENALRLVITTAVENLSGAEQQKCPNAGRLFLGEVGIPDTGRPLASRFPV